MPLIKKGTCESSVVVSSSVFACSDCGHVMVMEDIAVEEKCPKCGSPMKLVSSSGEILDDQSRC